MVWGFIVHVVKTINIQEQICKQHKNKNTWFHEMLTKNIRGKKHEEKYTKKNTQNKWIPDWNKWKFIYIIFFVHTI